MEDFIAAWTPTEYKGDYPSFINTSVDSGHKNIIIKVRGDDGIKTKITIPIEEYLRLYTSFQRRVLR